MCAKGDDGSPTIIPPQVVAGEKPLIQFVFGCDSGHGSKPEGMRSPQRRLSKSHRRVVP